MSFNVNRPLTACRYVLIRQGDTLQRIAARELGDTSQWPTLIQINGLVYPYITDDQDSTVDGVLKYGGTILVPSAAGVVTPGVGAADVLGTDILLSGGFLTAGNGDFATVTGIDNYKQALTDAFGTRAGSLLWHLTYGCRVRQVLGTANGPAAGQLAAGFAGATVLADPRTQSLKSSNATISGDAVTVTVEAVPIVGTPVKIIQGM